MEISQTTGAITYRHTVTGEVRTEKPEEMKSKAEKESEANQARLKAERERKKKGPTKVAAKSGVKAPTKGKKLRSGKKNTKE